MHGKRAIVTGAGRHIGRGTAIRLAREGASVALLDINEAWVQETVEMVKAEGGSAHGLVVDIRDSAAVARSVEQAVSWAGGVDALAHVAGVNRMSAALDVTEEDWDYVIDINLKGSFLVNQWVARAMRKQGTGGAMVNITSAEAEVAMGDMVPYCASKGGVRQLTKAFAVGLAPDNIRVNAVGPALIPGPRQAEYVAADPHYAARVDNSRRLRPRMGTADDIAHACLFLLSDEGDFITGHSLYVDGGVLAVR
ncbi:SDR family NAD(P)-dependent oxidoreductase [Pseudonocardia sp. GCM10023141]|uniref:SDR family NAD(P)-dependent oxidoreductase n=1 Tax=Pseudonocardia sp. GCM10023141 TaxID=3252653 RepID=UPI0036218D83